jgi:hypothetical protein
MALTQIDFDDEEEIKLYKYAKEWDLNKPKTIRKIIKLFEEKELRGDKN